VSHGTGAGILCCDRAARRMDCRAISATAGSDEYFIVAAFFEGARQSWWLLSQRFSRNRSHSKDCGVSSCKKLADDRDDGQCARGGARAFLVKLALWACCWTTYDRAAGTGGGLDCASASC